MATTATTPALAAGASADSPAEPGDENQTSKALRTGASAVEALNGRTDRSTAEIMGAVRAIGGALIGIAVLVVVLNEVFALDAISETNGSFGGIIDSLESTGAAALGLLIIGLLVLAANRVMGFFGGGGF